MLTFGPTRLRFRIGLIILAHLAIMIATIVLFARCIDRNHEAPLYRLPDPDRVALVTAAFERTPPDTHEGLLRAFSDSAMTVALLPRLPERSGAGVPAETRLRYRQALGGRPFRVETLGPDAPVAFAIRPDFSTDAVRVAVALPDGRALAIEQMVIAPIARILYNRIGFLAAVALIDVLVVLWLAAQTTRPVERLASAVREDRLDDLRREGPREIIDLAESFRQQRARLRALIQERTRMLAAIAHDYRTYLTRLQLRAEFIDDERQRDLAFADVEEMRLLLDDTLTFARDSASEGSSPASCDLAEEFAAIAADRAARGEDVAIAPLADPVRVDASHVSLQRMLGNLIDNALRYGGGRAQLRHHVADGRIFLCVEDEGPGVPEESLARLLEPFERLEPSRARQTGGVGLGLSIVQALAHRYSGELRLENRAEGGFRAILALPLA
jgi:two-component system osmolarity sensor histidine kinase EnvZ